MGIYLDRRYLEKVEVSEVVPQAAPPYRDRISIAQYLIVRVDYSENHQTDQVIKIVRPDDPG